jgi:hypothetical protein
VLNTLIIAGALHERGALGRLTVIRYETAVLDPADARAELARLVPEVSGLTASSLAAPPTEDMFATTTHKEDLTACLTAGDAGSSPFLGQAAREHVSRLDQRHGT